MKFLLILVLVQQTFAKPLWHQLENYSFESYVKDFNKNYSIEESLRRQQIFEENLQKIKLHNNNLQSSYKQGVNIHTDLTKEEFKIMRLKNGFSSQSSFRSLKPQTLQINQVELQDFPSSVDWRTKGVVNKVKDQLACGSCWAFGSTGALESHVAIQTGKLLSLSEQQLVCTENPNHCGGSGGCGGSTAELAYEWVSQNGQALESTYPYQGSDYGCDSSSKYEPAVHIDGYVRLTPNNVTEVMNALANIGPLAVLVDADQWEYYESGIFDDCAGADKNHDLDHVVVLIGYGTDEKGQDYWIIRNSWNSNWGEHGYMRIKRSKTVQCGTDSTPQDGNACKGDNKPQTVCGECGILFDVSYPTGVKLAQSFDDIKLEEI